MKTLMILLFMIVSLGSVAQIDQNINFFTVNENLLKGQKLAIIATDSLEVPNETINGVYHFSVNGFKQELKFTDGVAVCPLQIEKSAFVFIKHINEQKNPSNLYYVYQKNQDLNPIKINWYLLLVIPACLVLIGYMFRRMIGIVIFILTILFYFYYSKGLSMPTFFESVFNGIRNVF